MKKEQKTITNANEGRQNKLNVPTLRFKEYSDTWQETPFDSTFDILTNNTLSRAELNYEDGTYKNIHYGDVLIKFPAHIDVEDQEVPFVNEYSSSVKFDDALLQDGDIVIADTAEDYTVGKATEIENSSMRKVVSGLHTIPCRPKMKFAARYLGYYINSPAYHNQLIPYIQGVKVSSVSKTLIKNTSISYPSYGEQSKIAEFLSALDSKIETQNKIIEDLKILKKELMDYVLNTCDFMELSIKNLIDCGFARIIKASEMKKFDGTRKYLSTSSIGENGIEQVESIITYTDRPSRAAMLPIKGSIWFAKMKNSVKVYQSTDDDENRYILSTGFYGLLCDETKVNSRWLIELFKSDYFNTQKDKFSEGSSMSGIKDSQLADIKLKVFADKKEETYHTDNIQNLSNKIQLEKNTHEMLLKQKQSFLNVMFI